MLSVGKILLFYCSNKTLFKIKHDFVIVDMNVMGSWIDCFIGLQRNVNNRVLADNQLYYVIDV